MQFQRFSSSGLQFVELTLDDKSLVIQRGVKLDALVKDEQIQCASAEAATKKREETVASLQKDGWMLRSSPDPAADQFFRENFCRLLTAGSKRRSQPLSVLPRLEELYGFAFPEELRMLITLHEQYDLSQASFGEWQNMGDIFCPSTEKENTITQLIELDQKNYLGTALLEALCGLVYIGSAGNGDTYLAAVDPAIPERCEVFLWDHEERSLNVFADSITTLAYLNWIYKVDAGSIDVEGETLEVVRAELSRLSERASLSWHYQSMSEHAQITPSYKATIAAQFMFYRGHWIDTLLSGRTGDPAVDGKSAFFPQLEEWHAATSIDEARMKPRWKHVSGALYWCFYTYFFGDDQGLNQVISDLAQSSSQYARDASALFANIVLATQDKQKASLGKIEDLAALRKKFLEAPTAAQAHAAAERKAQQKQAAAVALRTKAEALIESSTDIESIVAAAQANVEHPAFVARLYEYLREQDPQIAKAMARIHALGDSSQSNNRTIYKLWLNEHSSPLMTPLLITRKLGSLSNVHNKATESPASATTSAIQETLRAICSDSAKEVLISLAHHGTPRDLAMVDAALEKRRGNSVYMIYPRLMREAIAERAGQPIDLRWARRALETVYADRDNTSRLHRVALGLLSRHAPKDEVRTTALRLLNWELDDVRQHARRVLLELGEVDRTRVIDPIAAAEIFADQGVEGLCKALRDPWAFPKHSLIETALAHGAGEAIAQDAIAAFISTYDDFKEGYGYYSGNYDTMLRTAGVISKLHGSNVDAFIHRLLTHPCPLLRPAISDEAAKNRARNAGPIESPLTKGDLTTQTFSAPAYTLGCTIHGLASNKSLTVAAGTNISGFFDQKGCVTPLPPEARSGWAFDVDIDPAGKYAALGYHACHLVVIDLISREIVQHLQLGGVPDGIKKIKFSPSGRYIATASDDDSIRVVDTQTGQTLLTHSEPYDVNGVAWVDEDTLAFITDHHVGTLTRTSGKSVRFDVKGGADVQVVNDRILAATAKHGIVWLDPEHLKVERTLDVRGVSRIRVSADGKVLWAACYEGDDQGLVRYDLMQAAPEKQTVLKGEVLYALALDPETGDVLAGGKGGQVHRVRADGVLVPRPATSHLGAIKCLARDAQATDSVLALDSSSRVLAWSLSSASAVARWPQARLHAGAESFAVSADDGLVVSAMNAIYGCASRGNERWSTELARSETCLHMGSEIIVGDGNMIRWLNPLTGETLAQVSAGVKSSWVAHLLAIDDAHFVVAGYDDPKLAVWNSAKRKPVREALIDRRHEDDRFSRCYGMTAADRTGRLYISFWNNTIECFDPHTLESLVVYDVPYSYEFLAVDPREQWLVVSTSAIVDVVNLQSGELSARTILPNNVTSLLALDHQIALAGLANGEIVRISWQKHSAVV